MLAGGMEGCMARMSRKAFERARTYLLEQARPLERGLFRFQFEGGSPTDVLEALGRFGNLDGGFGKALEPDYRAKASSVLATCAALGRMEELGVGGDHPLAEGAIHYLLDTFDGRRGRWVLVPGDGEAEPHAPWWNAQELEATFSGFRINPLAEVLGRLLQFGKAEGRRLARALLPELRDNLTKADGLAPSEVEGLLVLRRAPMDDPETRAFLDAHLRLHLPRCVEREAVRWAAYCLKPLWAVPSPAGIGATELGGTLEEALDYELRTQAADGAWEPNWDWGGAFPGHWQAARREWRGWLTLRNLTTLKAFGRLPKRR